MDSLEPQTLTLPLSDTAVDLEDRLVSSTGASAANLVLLPHVLPSGCAGGACTYTFTLTATHHAPAGARSAFAQQTIVMNRPPRGGRLAINPSTGFELNGTFALRAAYWVDDADDLPLRYSFYRYTYYDGNGTARVSLGGAASLTPQLNVLLPAGDLSLLVVVEDRYGATASAGVGATVLPLPVLGAEVVGSVLSRAEERLQSGDPQAATQASAALITSANARAAEGAGSGLGAAEAAQMREKVLRIVRDAAAATAPTAAAVGQIASAVEAVVTVVDQVSAGAAEQASELVGGLVNASLSMSEPLADGTSSAVVRAVSSVFSAVELLTAAADAAAASAADANATTSNGTAAAAVVADAGGTAPTPPPPPPAALYAGLRETLSALAHAMVKGALSGEAASTALAERVQLAVSLVAPATLRGATFAAPRGSSAGSVVLPTADLGLGPVADVEFSFTALQVGTRGAAAGLSTASSVASEYFDVTLSDHASLAPLDVLEAPEPIALLIPLDPSLAANPEPSACNASEAAAGLCGVCDASDARLGRHNCSGHGTCVHGRCWCDALYRGPACLQRLECRYWSEPEEAWSSSGLRTDNSSAAGAAAMAEGLLRCESSHLTEFAGFSLPTSADELLDEVQDLTLVLPCADGFFGAFEWQKNPLLYRILLTLLLLELGSLPCFAVRYKRRRAIARASKTSGAPGSSKPGGVEPAPDKSVLRSAWSSELSVEKHGCHTRVTPDAGGDGGGGGSSGFSVRGLLRVMRRGRRGQSTQVVPVSLSRSNSLSGRLSRTASGLSRSVRGLTKERSFRRSSPRSDPEDAYKATDADGDPSAPNPQRPPPSPRSLLSASPSASPSPPPSPSAPQPPIPPPSSAVATKSSRPNAPRPPPVHTSEGELSDLPDGVVEDFSGSVGDSMRSESCRSSFGAAASPGGAAYSPEPSRLLVKLESVSSVERITLGAGDGSSNLEIGGCSAPRNLNNVTSSTSSSSPLKPSVPLGSITNRAAPAYTDRCAAPPRYQQDGDGGGGGGGGGGGRLRTISSGDSDTASSRHSGVLTRDAAAAKIQAIARGKARRDFLRSALRCRVEMDQLGPHGTLGGATGGARSPEHRLAEAAEAAAAQAGLAKSSRLRRVSAEVSARLSQRKASLLSRRDSLLQSETVRLAQAGQWGQIGQKGASATKKGMLVVSTEARNRHSVLQVAVPLELDDTDEAHLRDEQACQIFWNCVVTEMLVQFLWSGTSATTECDEAEAVQTMAAAPNATVAGGGCQAGNLKVLTMIITGMFAAACLIATAVVCRIAFRLGNRPARRRWVGVARQGIAWAFNLGFWAGGCWVIIAYGRCMGREETDEVLIGALVGFGVSWMVMEPLWIILITLLPCLCNSKFMHWTNARLNDLGLDLSLILG